MSKLAAPLAAGMSVCTDAAACAKASAEMSTDKQDATASLLGLSLDHLALTIRAYNVLLNAGIQTVGDLVSRTADELLRLHRFGKASLFDVMQTLALHGLQLSGPQYSLPAAWCKIERRRQRLQPIRVARRNRANGRPAPPSIDPAVRASLAGKRLTDDAARAAVARLWVAGHPQWQIGQCLRYPGGADAVYEAIRKLIRVYAPEHCRPRYSGASSAVFPVACRDARRRIAQLAIERYERTLTQGMRHDR